jgi:hypothetical protein
MLVNERPSWANYIATDKNGIQYWYERKPVVGGYRGEDHEFWVNDTGRSELAMVPVPWQDSLEELPPL